MKKFIIIALVILTVGCLGNLIRPADVSIFFGTNISPIITNISGRVTVDIPNFEMKYDTVNLLVNGGAYGGNYYEKQEVGDIVRFVTVPPNTYDFYMSSDRDDTIYNGHLAFTALLDSVVVTQDMSVILPTEIQQALLLIDKSGITDPPLVKHTFVSDSSNWGESLMLEDSIYYYLYLYGSWNYDIKYLHSGDSGIITQTFDIGKVYIYNLNGIGINITDPFTDIIYNGG